MNGRCLGLLCLAIYVNCGTVPGYEILLNLPPALEASINRDAKSLQTPDNLNEIDSFDSPNVCTSAVCANESMNLLSYMDTAIDPCDNFYNFVCGKYLRETVLPEDKSVDLSFYRIADKLNDQIQEVLLEESQPNELHTVKLAKDFLKICLDEKSLNAAGIKPMVQYLEKYGGWPVTKGENEWNEDNWDWLNVKRQILNDGFLDDLIVEFTIRPDEKDTSKRALFIDRPDFGLSEKFLLEGFDHARVKYYYTYMVDLAIIFGADRSIAERDMSDVIQFETHLAKIALAVEDRRDASVTANYYNMTTLQESFPYIDWRDFIKWNLKNSIPVYENEIITVPDVAYLRQLDIILETTPKRTIANYIGMRLVSFASDILNDVLHHRLDQYNKEAFGVLKPDSRLTACIKKTKEFLPISTSAIYIRKFFNQESKDAAVAMAKNIHKFFVNNLKKVPWMDERTRRYAVEKANAMGLNIAYPDEVTNDQKLEEYHRELKLQPNSLLESVLRIRTFLKNLKIREFRQPIVKNDWRIIASRVTEVDAFYYPSMNAIVISAGILQDHLFKKDRPAYMNFATIGWFIGHEITHGFDDTGRQLDAKGNLFEWWDNDTLKEFNSRAKCFVDKYSKYKHPTLNLMVNGVNTQGENIADTGGIKISYNAYQRYVEQSKPEPILPNLSYTQNQLFWISAAHTWCGATRLEFDTNQYTTDEHSPFNHRINGAFSSLTQFANDFNCPPNSQMNPIEKCEIW